MKHADYNLGDSVAVDDRFMPPFAHQPAEVVRVKPSAFGSAGRDYLVEWATGERGWVVEWAVHASTWDPKIGAGCACGQQSVAYTPCFPQW